MYASWRRSVSWTALPQRFRWPYSVASRKPSPVEKPGATSVYWRGRSTTVMTTTLFRCGTYGFSSATSTLAKAPSVAMRSSVLRTSLAR